MKKRLLILLVVAVIALILGYLISFHVIKGL